MALPYRWLGAVIQTQMYTGLWPFSAQGSGRGVLCWDCTGLLAANSCKAWG